MHDEPFSLHPEGRRRRRKSAWLMRSFFLSVHLILVLAALGLSGWLPLPFDPDKLPAIPSLGFDRPAPAPLPPVTVAPRVPPTPAPPTPPPKPSPTPPPVKESESKKKTTPDGQWEEALLEGPPSGENRDVPAPSRPRSPEEVLAECGLTLERGVFTLDGDLESARRLSGIVAIWDRHVWLVERMDMIVDHEESIQALEGDLEKAAHEVDASRNFLDALPPPINNLDWDLWTGAKNRWSIARDTHQRIKQAISEKKKARVSPAAWKGMCYDKVALEKNFREAVPSLRALVDSVDAEYQRLGRQADVREALESLNSSGGSAKLGPSARYRETLQGLAKAEKELRKSQATSTLGSGGK